MNLAMFPTKRLISINKKKMKLLKNRLPSPRLIKIKNPRTMEREIRKTTLKSLLMSMSRLDPLKP
jgi:hypothetical protein